MAVRQVRENWSNLTDEEIVRKLKGVFQQVAFDVGVEDYSDDAFQDCAGDLLCGKLLPWKR